MINCKLRLKSVKINKITNFGRLKLGIEREEEDGTFASRVIQDFAR